MLRFREDVFDDQSGKPEAGASSEKVASPVVVEIQNLMKDQHFYTEHGLTIRRVAEALDQKEYMVRQAINRELGYRNFNQFLNAYRIREASRRLLDGETRRLPVLTIAIDVGYASLAPFNKAFKAAHGMTPTEYRKQHQ